MQIVYNNMNTNTFSHYFCGVDLNSSLHIGNPLETEISGGANVYWQDPVCTDNGFSSMDHVLSHSRALQRRLSRSHIALCRAISNNGLCSTDLSRKPSGYRGMPVVSNIQALPYGNQRTNFSLYSGRCQRIPRLAHLRRFRPAVDLSGKKAVCQRDSRSRPVRYCLCVGLHHYRPLPVDVPLGSISSFQSCGKSSYSTGPQRSYSKLRAYLRWKTARREYSGFAYPRAGSFLHNGSGIHGLRPSLRTASSRQFLCDTCQIEPRCSPSLFGPNRSLHRSNLRSEHRSQWLLQSSAISGTHSAYPLQRCGNWKKAGIPYQSTFTPGFNNLRSLQGTLACRDILQMDQTAPSHKKILRHLSERSENSDMDCRNSIRPYRDHKETSQARSLALYFATDSLGDYFRENALAASASG